MAIDRGSGGAINGKSAQDWADTSAQYATNSSNSANSSATSASNAATSASNAKTSENNAATYASNASTSASNASTSATNASTSASNAQTSANNAQTSANNAAASAASMPTATAADAGKVITVKPDGSGYQNQSTVSLTGTAGTPGAKSYNTDTAANANSIAYWGRVGNAANYLFAGVNVGNTSVVYKVDGNGNGYFAGRLATGVADDGTSGLQSLGTVKYWADGYGRLEITPTIGNGGEAVISQTTNSPRNGGDLRINVDAATQGGNLKFSIGGSEKGRLSVGGRWLFGTTTDDGVNLIQCNGPALFGLAPNQNLIQVGGLGNTFNNYTMNQNGTMLVGLNVGIPAANSESLVTAKSHNTIAGAAMVMRGNAGGEDQIEFWTAPPAAVTAGAAYPGIKRLVITSAGRSLFGNVTDNGVDLGQFNGTVSATGYKSSTSPWPPAPPAGSGVFGGGTSTGAFVSGQGTTYDSSLVNRTGAVGIGVFANTTRIGINNPTDDGTSAGIVNGTFSATAFKGDGSALTNVPASAGPAVAKAWVHFTPGATPTINDSIGVSSLTRNGAGNYKVNFSATLANANFAASVVTDWAGYNAATANATSYTTTSVTVNTCGITGTTDAVADFASTCVTIFSH